MKRKIIFMFSGQGSQYYQMGKNLYLNNSNFKKWMDKLDSIAIEHLGISVLKEIYREDKDKDNTFTDILFTHPALFIFQYALAQTLMENNIQPDGVLGTSLGEFVGASIAGIISAEEALFFVIKHAKLAKEKCEEGGMTAVLDNQALYHTQPILNKNCELISTNYSKHFVVSGSKNDLKKVQHFLSEKAVPYLELPVSYGFHSCLMDPIEHDYKRFLDDYSFKRPEISFISCVSTNALTVVPKDYFWDVTRKEIRFNDAVSKLSDSILIDLSPTSTLAGFAKNILTKDSGNIIQSIINPFGKDTMNFNKIVKELKTNYLLKKERQDMFAYVFPGQGSQEKGMGKELFEEFPDLVKKADEILGYSIKELCLEDKNNQLGLTEFTQPALFIVNALSYLKKIKDIGKTPDYVAGHSLGEYCALFASEVVDFETGLRLVMKRGALMCNAKNGSMAAVIGLVEEKVKELLIAKKLDSLDIANFNSPTQIVLSGPKDVIENSKSIFESAGARMYAILKVSGAFHSRYMMEARKEFTKYLETVHFSDIQIPIISNVTARPYKKKDIVNLLSSQITNSVKWTESICYLMGKGDIKIEQVGPGAVLTGLVKNIMKDGKPIICDETSHEETIEEEALSLTGKDEVVSGEKQNINQDHLPKNKAKKRTIEEDVDESAKTAVPGVKISAFTLGNTEFKKDFNLKYAYLTGSMYKGISSKEMVIKMGKTGFMGFFGTGGVSISEIEESIKYIQSNLTNGEPYGMNILYNPVETSKEEEIVDLYLQYNVKVVEASAYMSLSPALIRYRLKGLKRDTENSVYSENKIIAKISRPEVAEGFLCPAPEKIVDRLLKEGKITAEEAEMSREISVADALCVEADSGGHTDQGVAYALMPAILNLKEDLQKKYSYHKNIYIGAAGGIGTPEAAAAAFILGADFIVTGSINQCTVEARTSEAVKNLLQQANVQDTEYAPAGDMFEIGARVQVLKKGLFFPARANKLYELYRQYNSLDEIDEKTRIQIQDRYFKRSFNDVFNDSKDFYPAEEIAKAEKNPKEKMSMVFKWYFGYSTRLALSGSEESKVDYQIHCGPALGAFNQWVKDTQLSEWKNRNVDEIGRKIMTGTADLLNKRFAQFTN